MDVSLPITDSAGQVQLVTTLEDGIRQLPERAQQKGYEADERG